MPDTIRLGISTCPNDTFAFHGLMTRAVDWQGLDFRVTLLDVEELNQRLLRGEFDAAKASFHAALRLASQYGVFSAGAALGFGVGPLLLSRHRDATPDGLQRTSGAAPVVLCPGAMTTATMLYQIFFPGSGRIEHVVFSDIMPRLQQETGDFGVCIHEGRFTWRESGLFLAADLGSLWETRTKQPLPLGGILGKRALPEEVLQRVYRVIRDSVEYGLAHPAETRATMRQYAQELSDDVLFQHVDLYVNDQTCELGPTGRAALEALASEARRSGLVAADSDPLTILPA